MHTQAYLPPNCEAELGVDRSREVPGEHEVVRYERESSDEDQVLGIGVGGVKRPEVGLLVGVQVHLINDVRNKGCEKVIKWVPQFGPKRHAIMALHLGVGVEKGLSWRALKIDCTISKKTLTRRLSQTTNKPVL